MSRHSNTSESVGRTHRGIALLQIVTGGSIVGLWSVLLATAQVAEIGDGRVDIWFHVAAEMMTAGLLLGAGAGLLRRARGSRVWAALAFGALLYTVVNSAGYYAEEGQWTAVVMFAALGVVTFLGVVELLHRPQGRQSHPLKSLGSLKAGVRLSAVPAVSTSERSASERLLMWLEGLLAFGAFGGAFGLITGGINLGQATADLPFGSAVLAGWALAVVNGAWPTAILLGALRNYPWVRIGHLGVGVTLILWIVIQVAFLGWPPHWLQITYFVYGWLIVLLGLRLVSESPGGGKPPQWVDGPRAGHFSATRRRLNRTGIRERVSNPDEGHGSWWHRASTRMSYGSARPAGRGSQERTLGAGQVLPAGE